jgi:hypothetical protein
VPWRTVGVARARGLGAPRGHGARLGGRSRQGAVGDLRGPGAAGRVSERAGGAAR